MDLPTCPSCGASVLDEDVTECPSCGAPMKSSGKTSSPSPKDKPAPAKSAATDQPVKRRGRETVSDDDPFELERKKQEAVKVIPLARKPAKGKMFRVVCPMCDTQGFASEKVVGREVKCRNPECLAPVFTVPNPEAQERKATEEEEPKEKKPSKLPLIGAIVVSAGAIGGAYWYFTQVPDASELSQPFKNPVISQATKNNFSNNSNDKPNPLAQNPLNPPEQTTQNPQTSVDPAKVKQNALEEIVNLSRDRGNRSKPFSRRLAAEAYAVTRNIPAAREQMERIDAVSPPLPFYKIFPLIEIGWIQLKEKDQAGLKETLDQTIELSQKIPDYGGRDTLDLISRLAAFWIAAGKEDLATDLIRKYQAESNLAQLSAYLQIAQEANHHDFESLIDLHRMWASPQWVATTMILVTHGYPEAALNWAAMASDSADRTEAVTQWSLSRLEHAVKQQQKPDLSLVQPAEQKLSPTGNAMMLARCARELVNLNQKEAALAFVDRAVSLIKDQPVPTPITLGDLKEVNSMRLPQAAPLEQLAQTYLQIACAESELGKKAEALQYLKNAVQSIQATAPSLAAVKEKSNATTNFNFRDEIKDTFNLDTSDRINRAITEYNKQLRSLKAAGEQRSEKLVALLAQASRSGLAPEVWNLVQAASQNSNLDLKDALQETTLPAVILESVGSQNEDLKSQISKALTSSAPKLSKEDELMRQTASLIKNGKPEQAAHLINQSDLKKPWKGQLSLKLLSQLLNQSQFSQAVQFVTATKDPVLREDMLNTIGAVAVEQKQIPAVSKMLQGSNYTPTERISGYLGLITGIEAARSSQPETPPAKEPEKKL